MSKKFTLKSRFDIRKPFRNPSLRAKLVGLLFMAIGIYLVYFRKESFYIKIGFGAIFIGIFTFFIITEKTILKILNDAQMVSSMNMIYLVVNNLNLKGNGVYIPSTGKLSKERVFIPAQEQDEYDIPELDDDMVFITRKKDEKSKMDGQATNTLSALLIPPGLELLETYEKEMGIKIKNIDINELESYLQIMIYGLDIIKNLSIKSEDRNLIKVNIRHSNHMEICKNVTKNMDNLYRQTGCPICSSILCAITRSLGKKISIQEADIRGKEIRYLLRRGE